MQSNSRAGFSSSWVSAVSLGYLVALKLLQGELHHRVTLVENKCYENAPFPVVFLGREE